jgi:hypothetical protein
MPTLGPDCALPLIILVILLLLRLDLLISILLPSQSEDSPAAA